MQAPRDENFVPAMLFMGSDGETYPVEGSEITGRLFVDVPGGSGTVTSVSVVSANGLAGTVATATTTPAITLSTTITGILKGNGTAISAAVSGTDIKTVNGTSLLGAGDVAVTASPGGSDTQVQYNNAGALAGITGATTNGTALTLVAPVLGTPASGTLTNCVGLPISTGVSGLGANVATFLATPSSANLRGALTDETGTGIAVFNDAPTFATSITTPSVLATANDSGSIGVSGTAFSDLFLASGGVINWSAGDMSLIHSSGVLTISNLATGATGPILELYQDSSSPATNDIVGQISFYGEDSAGNKQEYGRIQTAITDTTSTSEDGHLRFWIVEAGTMTQEMNLSVDALHPASNDGLQLGNTTTQWSDLFLAEGGVINWDNGDVTVTQTGNVLAVAGGDLQVATAGVGTNADSVPTLSSTSTFTNKTLTSPTINTATIGGATLLAENASIDLDPTLSADGTYSGICITGTAGTTLAFGDLVYLAVADSRWELVDADSVTTCGAVLTGMCVLAAAADGDATKILLQGNIRADAAFPALTVGANVYAGLTPGDIVTTAPSATDDVVHVVGKALTADSIYFDPSEDYITIV